MSAALVAHAERLGPAYDLLAAYRPIRGFPAPCFFFERSGLGVAGSAVARRIPQEPGPDIMLRAAREAARVLGGIHAEEGAPAPVAVGALPFDDQNPGTLFLPSRTVRRTEAGETWRIDIGIGPSEEGWFAFPETEGPPRSAGPGEAFDEAMLRPDPEPGVYARVVEEATRRIRAGELRKVVLARSIVLDAGRELDPRPLLWRLRAVDPDCFTFGVPTARGVLVGASPELLVSRSGPEVRANPLAGSAPRFGDVAEDRASAEGLLASAKDREEHAVVVDAVADTLGPFCEQLTFPSEPTVLGTANVWHLSTPFHGRLRPPAPSAFDLVAALHPTPAVCGTPREAARATIAELESFARGCYAGPVGWVDANGDGEWAIALRCAEIAGTTARLFAGAGIVADSVPEQELDETERKFRALLDSLRWG